MARIEVQDDRIDIHLTITEEVLALHGTLHIPLKHIIRVSAERVTPTTWLGLRMGTNIPGVMVAGTFFTADGAVFYDIRRGERCLTLELAGETYRRVVVELDQTEDPKALAEMIETRRRATR